MTRDELIASARELPQPPAPAAEEYGNKREGLAAKINQRMRDRPDLERLIGDGNAAMMEDNHRNHARFMLSVLSGYVPEVLVETVIWVFRAYRAHGFRLTYWPAQLDTWVDILREELSPGTFEAVYPFYHWMIVNNPHFARLSEEDRPTVWDEPMHG